MCTFKISITALLTGLLCLTGAPLSAQEPTVTTLMTKELTDIPGKEVVLLMVEYAPGGADAIHRTMPMASSMCWRARSWSR